MSEFFVAKVSMLPSLSALRRFVLVCVVAWGSSIKADGGWWLLVPLEFAVWLICERLEGSTTFEGTTALLMVGIWSVANVVVKQS
jgi:hypothetical protein